MMSSAAGTSATSCPLQFVRWLCCARLSTQYAWWICVRAAGGDGVYTTELEFCPCPADDVVFLERGEAAAEWSSLACLLVLTGSPHASKHYHTSGAVQYSVPVTVPGSTTLCC
jgi:hypothetical protein